LNELEILSQRVGTALKAAGLLLVTAESCTGGWVAQALTSVAGSSEWFERGYVAYSNASKRELLNVRDETLARHGAVSEETALEMALGALARSRGQVALAVTGVAGPGGGTVAKPVGTVCFAWCRQGHEPRTETRMYVGDRHGVRLQSVLRAMQGVLEVLDPQPVAAT
jgi:nicotinamide-nucleotide amidase